jgi:hypothetical protein
MPLDKATKDNIIVAAITGAGPIGADADTWEANVLRGARRITAILSDTDSNFGKAIEEIDGAGKFVMLLSLVKKETKSTRGVCYFQEAPKLENGVFAAPRYTSEQISAVHAEQTAARAAGVKPLPALPEGLEAIRTDRTDTIDGLLMAKEASGLVGHRVLVYKVMEVAANNPNIKVRVLKLLTDLGAVDTFVVPAKAAAAAPAAA